MDYKASSCLCSPVTLRTHFQKRFKADRSLIQSTEVDEVILQSNAYVHSFFGGIILPLVKLATPSISDDSISFHQLIAIGWFVQFRFFYTIYMERVFVWLFTKQYGSIRTFFPWLRKRLEDGYCIVSPPLTRFFGPPMCCSISFFRDFVYNNEWPSDGRITNEIFPTCGTPASLLTLLETLFKHLCTVLVKHIGAVQS